MPIYYLRRAYEILRDEGYPELYKKSKNLFKNYMSRPLLELQKIRLKIRYGDSAPCPYDLIYVNHNNLIYCKSMRHIVQRELSHNINNNYGTFIIGGDWDDKVDKKFENYSLWQATVEHFEEGVAWKDTSGFENHPKDVSFFKPISDLYSNIQLEGYKTQRELGISYNKYFMPPEFHEIRVNIGRDGTLFFDDGRHRFCVIKLLDVNKKIPVRVYVRHKKWQEIRDDIQNNGLSEEYKELRNHPDLQNILD